MEKKRRTEKGTVKVNRREEVEKKGKEKVWKGEAVAETAERE